MGKFKWRDALAAVGGAAVLALMQYLCSAFGVCG